MHGCIFFSWILCVCAFVYGIKLDVCLVKNVCVCSPLAGCPHCKNAVPHFTTAAELFKEDRKVSVANTPQASVQMWLWHMTDSSFPRLTVVQNGSNLCPDCL